MIVLWLLLVQVMAKWPSYSGNQIYVPDTSVPDTSVPDSCPPCFNCMLPMFACSQFSECDSYTGQCECIPGFGGLNCSDALCGALDLPNRDRPPRAQNLTYGRDNSCACADGWGGINCNLCQRDDVCDSFMPDSSLKGTCYRGGALVHKGFQGCDVTNEKILQVLHGQKPQVTFSCDRAKEECNFQFWVDQIESFYCGLDNCTFEHNINDNTTHYKCANAQCKCVPGTLLCGLKGSIDISEFLTETITGPADFACERDQASDKIVQNCKFSEPSMNDLISTVFGDRYITLSCNSGECVHHSEIPGYKIPSRSPDMTLKGRLMLAFTSLVVLVGVSFVAWYVSQSPLFKAGSIQLLNADSLLVNGSADETENFLQSSKSATLTFENINYYVAASANSKSDEKQRVLNDISGLVKPGEILSIMGGSGAGKTTLLDILAMKRKTGDVSGSIRVNGKVVSRKDYTKLIGFVDQDDYLLPTLTVYETVLNSALLRLPRTMSFEAKQARVFHVLEELRIMDIKDRIVGNDFERGISGGEKRRVSIACELVTSPLVLFLDEPTSGLDANNANNVIECLVRLARNYDRTLVMSIHQPRSNIFYRFDKLVLLSRGELVYSGEALRVNEFLKNNGYQCPSNYNIADYLIDITFESGDKKKKKSKASHILSEILPDLEVGTPANEDGHDHAAEILGGGDDRSGSISTATQREWEHYATHREEISTLLRHETEENLENEIQSAGDLNTIILSKKFKDGQYYGELKFNIEEIKREANPTGETNTTSETSSTSFEIPTTLKAASFSEQLSILCSRSFKNIYRNPKLLLGNYLLTVLLGVFLGVLYYKVENDISGFQNRMGLFFFILTYFGFVTFTGLSSFALERIIFLKERSNNYYSPLAYYGSKILVDVIPLRVIPPILLCMIVYPLVGLNMRDDAFFKCIGILVLFNLAISMEILTIGIIFEDLNNSIVISVLVLLASLLFSGLFINTKDITNMAFKYLKNFSVFYYAYEALLINEVKTLMLRERKYGLNIEVPGAIILSTFGFQVQNLVFDIKTLALFNAIFLVLGYLALKLIVVEQK